ncbi:thioredoxin-2 [Drosophila hydei]|uniref:Thioredoxin-2 n=1 Tax=Drosophila hydei TaxID=7224 RepID=A0A6J1LFG1_DROHY|nr:thioredoxin-2 [Drosophila hydei]
MVHVIQSKEDFEQQLSNAGDKLIVIDFCANWCGPCKIIAPKLEELAAQYAERAVVLKVNVDDNEEITIEYNITSMPTFVFIKSGEVLEVFVGGNSEKLAKSMEKFVGDADEPFDEDHHLQQQLSMSSESAASGSTVCDLSEDVEGAHDLPSRVQSAMDKEGILEN